MISTTLIWILLLYFSMWFVINTIAKNAGLIDIAWGLGFVLLAITQYFKYQSKVGIILVVMVGIWGLRLAIHIAKRNIGKAEDHRYQQFRKDWGKHYFIRSIFQIYFLQATLMLIVSLTFLDGIRNGSIVSKLGLVIGLIIYSIGLYFEVVSDFQMTRFKRNHQNKGKLMREGLWAISRHPNYFGEATLWLGVALVSLSLGSNGFALVGSATIYYLIRFLSGVPLMEKRQKEYQEFSEYEKEVPIFFPKLKGGNKK